MSRLIVLYEDSLGEPKPTNYGPHVLALACAADALGLREDYRKLGEKVDARPMKGVGNLLREMSTLAGNAEWLAACIDSDKCREHVKLPATACKCDVLSTIRAKASNTRSPVAIVLLEQNLESVYRECCAILGRTPARAKPRPLDRDTDLHALATAPDRAVRDKLLARVDSWARLVRLLTFWLAWNG